MKGPPYLGYLGVELRDDAIAILAVSEGHLSDRERGTVHGGVIAAFMEAAAALALGQGRAVDFTADFLRPAGPRPLFARVVVVRRGRRFTNVRVDVWQDEESALVAVGSGTFQGT